MLNQNSCTVNWHIINLLPMFFFFFFLFEPLLLSNLITFLFLIHFQWFKDEHTRDLLGVSGTDFDCVQWFVFLEFLTPFTLWGCNFSFHICFWQIVSVSDATREGVQILLGHQKQWSPPLGSSLPWILKFLVTIRSTLMVVDNHSSFEKKEKLLTIQKVT